MATHARRKNEAGLLEQLEAEIGATEVAGERSELLRAAAEEITQLRRLLEGERLWDAADVARFLGASRNWVYLRAEEGKLPSVKHVGLVRFVPSLIKPFLRGEAVNQRQGQVIVLPAPAKE